jgi:uncharacterized membrane protein
MVSGEQKRFGEEYPQETLKSDYKTGRFLARVISFFGWLLIAFAVVVTVFALGAGQLLGLGTQQTGVSSIAAAFVLLLSGIITGTILVASGHFMRATMDTANATRQMLRIMQQ